MSDERTILSACIKSRPAFETVERFFGDGDMSEQGKIIYGGIAAYYRADGDVQSVDPAILERSIVRELSSPKHQEMFRHTIRGLAEADTSPANVVQDIIGAKRQSVRARLASTLLAGGDVDELIAEYGKWSRAEDLAGMEAEADVEEMTAPSVVDLVRTRYTPGEIIPVWPKSLNDRLDGGLIPGHHLVLFARPEMGKTMMLVNMVAGFVRAGHRVLYVGNEDPLPDVIMRVVSRLSGMNRYEVLAAPDVAEAEARANGYDLVTFVGLAPGTPREVEALVRKYEPKVLIIDQLRNLEVNQENKVLQLEEAGKAVRMIGKRNKLLVVSSTQAGDSASGRAVLEMTDVDFSNTGIPSVADVMIGMGATKDDEAAGRRVLHLCKNKRSGNHDFFPVQVDVTTNKVRSMG